MSARDRRLQRKTQSHEHDVVAAPQHDAGTSIDSAAPPPSVSFPPALDFSLDQLVLDQAAPVVGVPQVSAASPLLAEAAVPDTGPGAYDAAPFILQALLRVNRPDDAFEAEADAVARHVMRQPDRAVDGADMPPTPAVPMLDVQRASTDAGVAVTPEIEAGVAGLQGGGTPLPEHEQTFFGERMGVDVSDVRIHQTPDLAQALNARAFTVGADIAFDSGEYQPGTAGGRELLAHELTHVVQQNSGIAAKRVQRKEDEREPAADAGICPVCGRVGKGTCPDCGAAFLPLQRKARTDLPDATPDQPTTEDQAATTPATEPDSLPTGETDAVAAETAAGETTAAHTAVAPAPTGDHATAGSPRAEDVGTGNPLREAVQQSAADGPRQALQDQGQQLRDQLRRPAAPSTADTTPQLAPLDPAAGQPDPAIQDALTQVQAGQEQARGQAEAAGAELAGTQDTIGQLAGAPVELAPLDIPALLQEAGLAPAATDSTVTPIFRKEADTPVSDDEAPPDPAALVALIEQLRGQAQGMVSDFMAGATGRVQGALALGQAVPTQLQAPVAAAQAAIMAGVQAQHAAVTAQFAQARSQAESMAETQRAQLEAQHNAALSAIQATTVQTTQQLEAGYQQAVQRVEQLEQAQRQTLTQRYAQADQEYRAAGARVGQEAITAGEQMAGDYRSEKINRDDSFMDGDLTDRRCEARAKAAREVSSQYQAGLVEEANTQAGEAQKGMPRDLATLGTIKTEALTTLEQQHRAMLEQAQASAEAAQQQAEQAKTQFLQAIEQSLTGTMQTLSEQESSQLQGLESLGQQQVAALDQAGQSAIAALQQSVTQTVSGLHSALGGIPGALAGVQVPDPEAVSGALGGALEQIEGGITALQDQIAQGIATAEQQFMQQSTQAVQTLEATGQDVAASVSELIDALTQSFSQLQSGVGDTYSQIQEGFSTQATQLQETATAGFGQVVQGTEQTFTQVNQQVDTAFDQAALALEQGLRGALNDMRAKIRAEAEKAAAQEQPRWKGILKIVLIIAVIVVVALVIGPFVIGAVGAAAGALGASAAAATAIGAVVGGAIVGAGTSAVIQMGSNLIDGKPVLDGVVDAMIVGAIGGALGGLGGLAGQGLVNTLRMSSGFAQGALKLGVDMAFDTVGGILGNLATGQPLTLDGIVQGFLSGAAVSLSMGGLGKLGRFGQGIEGIQQRSMAAGGEFGTNLGTQMRPTLGIDVPAPRAPQVDVGTSAPRSLESDTPGMAQRPANIDEPDTAALTSKVNEPDTAAPTSKVNEPETAAPTNKVNEPETTPSGTVDNEKTEYPLATGASKGLESSEITIQHGTVRMQEHPEYPNLVQQIEDAGFQVKLIAESEGAPRVEIRQIVDKQGAVIATEKTVYLQSDMRYLDAEHELGHVKQIVERFEADSLPTERVVDLGNGRYKQAPNQAGVLTKSQNSIIEYHNRLIEFIRLKDRGANPEVLAEHAQGIRDWRSEYYTATKNPYGSSKIRAVQEWAQNHFPDLTDLVQQYNDVGGRSFEI